MVYNRKITIWTILEALFLIGLVFVMIYPFVYILAVTFSDKIYVMRNEISFYPKSFSLDAYRFIFMDKRILLGYKNTVIFTIVGTFIALFITSMAAYALSKKRKLAFHSFFTWLFIVPMFFGGGMIPTFIAVKNYGLIDKIWAVVLPSALSIYNMIIMRTFFQGFPTEIEESGELDGLNDPGIFWYLIIPMSKAIFATIGLFYAVGKWNDFMTPFLYLNAPSMITLQLVLRQIVLQGTIDSAEAVSIHGDTFVLEDSLKYAAIIVTVAPIIAVYPFIQKYFVKGVMIGSLKG